jgi:hypothetical protein
MTPPLISSAHPSQHKRYVTLQSCDLTHLFVCVSSGACVLLVGPSAGGNGARRTPRLLHLPVADTQARRLPRHRSHQPHTTAAAGRDATTGGYGLLGGVESACEGGGVSWAWQFRGDSGWGPLVIPMHSSGAVATETTGGAHKGMQKLGRFSFFEKLIHLRVSLCCRPRRCVATSVGSWGWSRGGSRSLSPYPPPPADLTGVRDGGDSVYWR